MIEINVVRDRVIFGRTKWESSFGSSGMVLPGRHQYPANTIQKTYGIASIVPESVEAYYDSQPEAFISVSARPYLCFHNDHRDRDADVQ